MYKKNKDDKDWIPIQSKDIINGVRASVIACGLHKKGINPKLVASHSLRAGGAMALKLKGVADTIIMKMGRWSGLTFVMYIHNQIAHISSGLSAKMQTRMPFVNIGNINMDEF